ncbi:helix-turn-helix domain-containing protein [Halorussus sp. GCM10023401]|nr:helix-turn-helix domain-containing protein [Halorussus vallis]USZ75994.1 helix-turn-helix domain-containing protein [Halorussus vallis]
MHASIPIESESEIALTDAQQEALVLAYEQGYFYTPHVTMADLGDELGISQQAVASRLRPGISLILGSTLAELQPLE